MTISHLCIDDPEEVDFILRGINLGLQLHLDHVGSINILKKNERMGKYVGSEISNGRS